ncbi:cell wall hydrolase [Sphingomonas sp. PL20]|uniref:cell wall hydrolase n=1 Tax=Sphingomonas sp. PL20 TaxID=2760712 RepID=UPI001AE44499
MARFDFFVISPARLAALSLLVLGTLLVAAVGISIYFARLFEVPEASPLLPTDQASPASSTSAPTADLLPLETFLPQQKLDITPSDAFARNVARPLTMLNPAPPVFSPDWLSPKDLAAATECLATALYYEANGEPTAGQLAVAQVILNRVRHPRYPKTVCGVVYQGADRPTGCQFSFTCDGSLRRRPEPTRWKKVYAVAQAALHGIVSYQVGQATHYHTVWIVPVWASELAKVAIINNHVFYRPIAPYGAYPFLTTPGKLVEVAPEPDNSASKQGLSAATASSANDQSKIPVQTASPIEAAKLSAYPATESSSDTKPAPKPTPSANPYFSRPNRRTGNLAIPNN